MLCPKCGYITFDKLTACPKCRGDWSEVTEKVGGTSSSIDSACFLGKVIGKETGAEEEAAPEVLEDDISLAEIVEAESREGEEDLDVSLDELPEIDLSGLESVTPDKGAEEEAEVSQPPAGPPDPPKPKESQPGQKTGLDLNDIDLSDLVTQEEEVNAGAGTSESLDLDLSALEIDTPQSASASTDLDLSGEELDLDLSLDLESEVTIPKDKKSGTEIPDLGLSLDLDDK